MLKIYLFGRIRLQHDQSTIELKITPSVQALLAYLLIQPHRTYSRDILMEIGWGDRPQEQARGCLNTAMWRLRNILEPEGMRRGAYLFSGQNGDVGFNWDSDFWMDTLAFEDAIAPVLADPQQAAAQQAAPYPAPYPGLDDRQAARLAQVIPLYSGLLEGFDYDWVLEERERKRSMYLNCLRAMHYYYRSRERYDLAIDAGQKILHLEPLREEIHRDLMATYVLNGQRALAIHQYEMCHNSLQNELGIEPMPETRALYEQLLAESRETLDLAPAEIDPRCEVQQAIERLNHTLAELDTARQEVKRTLAVLNRIKFSA